MFWHKLTWTPLLFFFQRDRQVLQRYRSPQLQDMQRGKDKYWYWLHQLRIMSPRSSSHRLTTRLLRLYSWQVSKYQSCESKYQVSRLHRTLHRWRRKRWHKTRQLQELSRRKRIQFGWNFVRHLHGGPVSRRQRYRQRSMHRLPVWSLSNWRRHWRNRAQSIGGLQALSNCIRVHVFNKTVQNLQWRKISRQRNIVWSQVQVLSCEFFHCRRLWWCWLSQFWWRL